MKCEVLIFVLCLASTYARVAVDETRDSVSNLIDDKQVKIRPDSVNNTSDNTNVSDNLISPKLIVSNVNITDNKVLSEDTDPCERSEHELDNLINADLIICPTIVENDTASIETTENPLPLPVSEDNGTALILTKYIREGKIEEGRLVSKVDPSAFLGVKSYSGFFTVNETYDSNIFFWYFPVLNKSVSETPWIIWLQGGPGASSMTGLFDEIGPFSVVNGSLKRNPHTWLRNHSLVFIDNPVGTGYSFTNHTDGFVTDMATYAAHLYSTVKQLVTVYPELKTAPLYIAGESYAGKYVPAMAMEIHKRNQNFPVPPINLQGMIIGNAYVDPDMISHLAWPFYYFGLLVKEQMDIVKPLVEGFQNDIKANRSVEAKEKWNSLITVLLFMTHQRHAYNFLRDDMGVGKYDKFLQTSRVKRAIHVGDIKFGFVNMTVNSKLVPDFLSTTKPLFEKLLNHYKVLAYCGQLDQMLPCAFTSESYRTWKWNASDQFIEATRYPYMYNHKLAGYQKSGGRFTEVVFRGAGHMVPLDVPAPAQDLVAKWTHDKLHGTGGQQFFVMSFLRAMNTSSTYYM